MFNFRNKAFLYVAIATTCLTSPAERLCAGSDETLVVLEQVVPGNPLPAQTFFVPTKGLKIAKNPLSISSLDTYTVTLTGVTKVKGVDQQAQQTSYDMSTFLPLWQDGAKEKVIASNATVAPGVVMTLSSPILTDQTTLQFDGTFGEAAATIPDTLRDTGVMKVNKPTSLFLTPLVEIDQPAPTLHSLNVGGEIKAVAVGKDESGSFVDLTFADETVSEFESTPYYGVEPYASLKDVAAHLNENVGEIILDLGGNGVPFVSSLKPKSIKVMDKTTLRVGLDAKHVDAVSYYERIFGERVAKHPRGAFALFANYSKPPVTEKNKNPHQKEDTFFLFAQKGATFKQGKGKTGEAWNKVPYYVTFHGVDKVVGVDSKGGQREFTNGQIAKIIGKGTHPFKPNGVFLISPSYENQPQYVTLSFDKAKVDPKTNDITFEVGFLQAASYHKGVRAVPPQFLEGKPVKVEGPITVFLDSWNSHLPTLR